MEIRTTDLYYAAALMANGAVLAKTDKSDSRHMRFCIEIPAGSKCDAEELESQWVNSTLTVNAAAFRDSIQRLKAVIHSE
jgi:hypothetical protein